MYHKILPIRLEEFDPEADREAQSPPTRCVSTQPPEVFEYDPTYKQKVSYLSRMSVSCMNANICW